MFRVGRAGLDAGEAGCARLWKKAPGHRILPLRCTHRLYVRRGDGALGRLHCGVEAEGAVDDAHVVVDGLGDARHRHLEAALAAHLVDGVSAAVGAVSANHVEL